MERPDLPCEHQVLKHIHFSRLIESEGSCEIMAYERNVALGFPQNCLLGSELRKADGAFTPGDVPGTNDANVGGDAIFVSAGRTCIVE